LGLRSVVQVFIVAVSFGFHLYYLMPPKSYYSLHDIDRIEYRQARMATTTAIFAMAKIENFYDNLRMAMTPTPSPQDSQNFSDVFEILSLAQIENLVSSSIAISV
jgi:hypothetical protein